MPWWSDAGAGIGREFIDSGTDADTLEKIQGSVHIMQSRILLLASILAGFFISVGEGFGAEGSLSVRRTLTLPFAASDVVFDEGRLRLYATDGAGRRVVGMNLSDGSTAFSVTYTNTPEALAMRSDGQRLYVGLVVQPHSYYWWEPHDGYIGRIDLVSEAGAGQFRTSIDPYDLVASEDGWVVVSDGSGQWTDIASFNGSTGVEVGRGFIRQGCRLALHPDENAFYSADTDSSPSDIRRWSLNPATGEIVDVGDSPYHGEYPMSGKVWVHPRGSNLVTRGGAVMTSSNVRFEDMRFIRLLESAPFESVAFDVTHKAVFSVGYGPYPANTPMLTHYGPTYEMVASYYLTNLASEVFVFGDSLYLVSVTANRTLVTVAANPAVGGETNQPPVPDFTWLPAAPTTLTPVTFDASSSSDVPDVVGQLVYRWDWEADGVWDTTFTNSPLAVHRYNLAGTKTVRLEAKDRYGVSAIRAHQFNVTQAVDPGTPGGDNPAFEIPFAPADLVHDVRRHRLYATDMGGKRLVFFNFTNGFIEREFHFDFMPESIAITPNGSRLYVALLTRPHGSYYFDTHRGYIAEFDLATGVKTREVEVALDPGDIVANDFGILVIADGSDQSTVLATVRASTGQIISTVGIYQGARLELHPNQAAAYAGDVGLSPSDFRRIGFDPVSGVHTGFWESIYHGDYPLGGQPYLTPDGGKVVSRGGTVVTSSSTQADDLKFSRSLEGGSFTDLAFDPTNRAIFTVATDYFRTSPSLLNYFGDSLELVSTETLSNVVDRVFATPQLLYLVSFQSGRAVVTARPNPAEGATTNQPPSAAFAWAPTNPTTLTHIEFDATGSTDESPFLLTFRWDWEADGEWDTPFTNAPMQMYRYNMAGTKTVRLQVKDRNGSVALVEHSINVAIASDPGNPVAGGVAFELQFAPADVEFDPVRPHLYATDYDGRRLLRVNTTNGFAEREFYFDYSPEAIAITPDGRRMYVALLLRPHGYYYFDTHRSFVAEFDLETGVKTREMELDVDPYDMVVTDTGWLVVADGSDQWTEIVAYRASTGAKVGTSGIYQGARLALHPSQTIVYATDTALSPSDIHHFDLNPSTGALTGGWDSIYHGDHDLGGQVFVTPDGGTVFSRGGSMLTSSSLQQFDLRFVGMLPVNNIEDAAFDSSRGVMALVGGNRLSLLDTANYTLLAQYTVPSEAQWVDLRGGRILTVSRKSNSAIVQTRRLPAGSLAENLPPVIAWLSPVAGSVWSLENPVMLRAGVEDEDGSVTNVSFYADGALVGSASAAPFEMLWSTEISGARSLWAVAWDNFGVAATSQVAHVTFNRSPVVSLISPTNGQPFLAPSAIQFSAMADDADGQVARVDLIVNGEVSSSRSSPPYLFAYGQPVNGPLVIQAVATDDLGASSFSPAVNVTVTGFASDLFDARYPMQGSAITVSASNRSATKQKGEPNHAGNPGGKSVWWSWTAPGSGTVVITTVGSDFDTLLAVYTGLNVSNLVAVAFNDDDLANPPFSRVKVKTTAGAVYHIAVDGYEGAAGTVSLAIDYFDVAPAVPNDQLGDAIPLSGLPVDAAGNNVGASRESFEPSHAGNSGGRSVWWRWVAPVSGPIEVSTSGSDFDTLLAVYAGNQTQFPVSMTNLRLMAANDDSASDSITSRIEFNALADTTYYVAIDGYQAAAGNVMLHLRGTTNGISVVVPPANDMFADRFPISGADIVVQGSTVGATREVDEPLHADQPGSRSAWWTWTSPGNGMVTISTKGSTFDTLLAVYSGTSANSLALIAANDDAPPTYTSTVNYPVTAGAVYQIAVDGYQLSEGRVTLAVNFAPSVSHAGILAALPGSPPERWFSLSASSASLVVLERSSNMVDWSACTTNRVANGAAMLRDNGLLESSNRFYRVRVIE